MDVLRVMYIACKTLNASGAQEDRNTLDAARKAVAELIEAAEEYMVNSIPTSDHLRLKLALAAVTAHPNDAEGRT